MVYAQVLNTFILEGDSSSAIEKRWEARFQLPKGQKFRTVNSSFFCFFFFSELNLVLNTYLAISPINVLLSSIQESFSCYFSGLVDACY